MGEPALNEEGAARRVPLDALADTRRTRPRLSADMPEGTMVTRAVAAAGGAARSKTAALVRRGLELGERVARRRAVECPVCGWEGLRFRPMAGARLRFDAECPRCGGVERHRILALLLRRERLPTGLVLYVAPEPSLAPLVHARGPHVVTLDLFLTGVDIRADVEALPLPDRSAALVVISDVLEHVADDRRAMREIARVLRADGSALIHVPVLVPETIEYGRAVEAEFGHRRVYGADVLDRLWRAGLEATPLLARDVPTADRRRHGIVDGDVALVARPRMPSA